MIKIAKALILFPVIYVISVLTILLAPLWVLFGRSVEVLVKKD